MQGKTSPGPGRPVGGRQSGGQPTRRLRLGKAVASIAVLAVVVAGLSAFRLHHEGHYFRHLKPNEWWLRWRGVYRYDPDRFIVRQGAPGQRMVALTFDDGPHAITTGLLDALKAHDARATFFLVGSNVKRRPEIVRRIISEGHDIGNHTRSHLRLPPLRTDQVRNEIINDTIVIAEATGERVRLFRPPGGQYDERVLEEAARHGLLTVLWSNNTGDWQAKEPRWIVRRVLSSVEDGDIVLMHEEHAETLAALPEIVRGLQARGFRLVTVSEMLEASGYALPPLPPPKTAGSTG